MPVHTSLYLKYPPHPKFGSLPPKVANPRYSILSLELVDSNYSLYNLEKPTGIMRELDSAYLANYVSVSLWFMYLSWKFVPSSLQPCTKRLSINGGLYAYSKIRKFFSSMCTCVWAIVVVLNTPEQTFFATVPLNRHEIVVIFDLNCML